MPRLLPVALHEHNREVARIDARHEIGGARHSLQAARDMQCRNARGLTTPAGLELLELRDAHYNDAHLVAVALDPGDFTRKLVDELLATGQAGCCVNRLRLGPG